MPKVSVTTVNYNSQHFIKAYIDSINAQSFKDLEIIIVDNGSVDNSVKLLKEGLPFAKIIEAKENLGYCKAQNIAINNSSGEFIITLNPDISLDHTFIEEIVLCAQKNPKAGSISPKLFKMIDGEKTNIIDTCGHSISKGFIAKNIGDGQIDKGQFDNLIKIDGVSGAAPLHKKEMLESIKHIGEYLDEDLFISLDDVDIDIRSKNAGWQAVFCPKAVGWHMRSSSVSKMARKWNYYNYRNRYLMILKNASAKEIILNTPAILLFETGMFFTMLFQMQLLPVFFGVLKKMPNILKKRKLIK